MAIDWKDLRREDELHFYMISPQNLNQSYGELEGVDLSGSSLSCEYYTDTRTSGSLRVVGDGWVRGSFIRVVHEVPEWDYKKVLGTYLVTSDDATWENGVWTYDLELESLLYAMSTDLMTKPWTRAKGSSALAAIKKVLETCKRPYVNSGAKDKKLGSALVMESGTSYLEQLYTLCESSNNRLDVAGDGKVTVSPYKAPSSKEALFTIDLLDERGITQDGVKRTTDWLSSVNRAAVSHKWTTSEKVKVKKNGKWTTTTKSVEHEINAWATVSANNHAAPGLRGYTVTEFHSVSELSPRTHAQAQKLANDYLKKNSPELIQWEVNCTYLPIWEGDVVYLVVHDGLYTGRRKCFVKSMDLDLEHMEMSLTLKETGSGDKGDEDD